MWLWRAALFASIIIQVVLSASIFPCPESCKCTPEAGNYDRIQLNCTATAFLAKLKPKQTSAIVKLELVGLGLTRIDPRLKQLKRLESLNLSHNNLSSLVDFPILPNLESISLKANALDDIMTGLPKGLKQIDVSSNHIQHITKQWTAFKKLSTVNLTDNPINCSCDTLHHFHQLTETLVQIDPLLTCHSPDAFKGKYVKSVNCSMVIEDLLNSLMGDAPSDNNLDAVDENTEDPSYDEDEEFLTTDDTMDENNEGIAEEEGSGYEGSGTEPPDITEDEEEIPKACYINCSTPKPLGLNDEDNASPPPSLKETQDILIQDIFGKIKESSDPREEKIPPPQEIPIVEIGKRPISQGKNAPQKEGATVEMVQTKENITGEMERAVMGGRQAGDNSLTYYILGGLLAVFVALILIVTLRKRQVKNRKRPRSRKPQNGVQENGHMEEMKPLNSNSNGRSLQMPTEKTKEEMPLVAGPDGVHDNEPKSESPEDMTDHHWPQNKDTLKVTIKASEIPDSVPRTPTFVQRSRDAEGNYTTTPESSP